MNFKATLVAAAMACAAALPAAAQQITGAGSTFVYPVLAKWSDTYSKQNDTRINYQSIGSGGGIAQIKAGTVTFGATDMPMKPADLTTFGLALMYLHHVKVTDGPELLVFGTGALGIGVGFLIAAATSLWLSRSLGILGNVPRG